MKKNYKAPFIKVRLLTRVNILASSSDSLGVNNEKRSGDRMSRGSLWDDDEEW